MDFLYLTMDEEGNVCESYGIENTESALNAFRSRYLDLRPEIALEVSTSGKYIARKLRDMGFSVHLADTSKLSLTCSGHLILKHSLSFFKIRYPVHEI